MHAIYVLLDCIDRVLGRYFDGFSVSVLAVVLVVPLVLWKAAAAEAAEAAAATPSSDEWGSKKLGGDMMLRETALRPQLCTVASSPSPKEIPPVREMMESSIALCPVTGDMSSIVFVHCRGDRTA